MQAIILIAQGLFVYFLLWWVAFPSLLAVNLPDFSIGKIRFTHHVGKKAVVASILALLAWLIVFPLVISDWISFGRMAENIG